MHLILRRTAYMLLFVFFSPSPSGIRPISGLRNRRPDSKERKMNRATQNQRAFLSFAVRFFSLLLGSLLLASAVATAQTESVLYNFTGKADGADPYSTLLQDPRAPSMARPMKAVRPASVD
jgi:hypothetical protein